MKTKLDKKPAALLLSACLAALFIINCPHAEAVVVCSGPDLPPGCGVYRTPADVHAEFADPDPAIVSTILMDTDHHRFLNVVIIPVGPDELEQFDSSLDGTVQVTLVNPASTIELPFHLEGPVQVISQGRVGNQTGTFDTEIVAMNLTGNVGGFNIELRESPTQQSNGLTKVTDIGGGLFEIDSFFDIFTEVSINGGAFVPATGPVHVDLVPEPSAAVLSLLGIMALLARRRRA